MGCNSSCDLGFLPNQVTELDRYECGQPLVRVETPLPKCVPCGDIVGCLAGDTCVIGDGDRGGFCSTPSGGGGSGLDQDTYLDRNPNEKPQLDVTGGTNGTEEAKIEFWRAPLLSMYNDGDGGTARIVARFFPVNGTDNSCLKDGDALYSWVSGVGGLLTGAPTQGYSTDVGSATDYWMTGSIEDKTDINGTATSAIDVAGESRTQMLVLIDILKSKIKDPEGSDPNPLWHPEAADAASVTVGDFKVCVNIQVERHLDLSDDGSLDTWVPLLWRDFLVFMGVNLKDNVFSIGDEGGIEVKIDAVENATSTYEKPALAFYQCKGSTTYTKTDDIGTDVDQNGLIQMCLMPESDDVYICELEMDVDVDGTKEAMQKVNKIALAANDETPAGTPAQSSIVNVYNRKYVDCPLFGPGQCNVQKTDTQTLADQAGKFLNITGTVTYCFRAETGRRLENVPFNLNDNQLRSLQQADEGAGAEPFSFSLKIDKIQFDGDKVLSDGGYVINKDNMAMNGEGNLDSYSAAAAAATSFGRLLKMFVAIAGVMAVLF